MNSGLTLEMVVQEFLTARATNPKLTPEEFCQGRTQLLPNLLEVLSAITSNSDATNTFEQRTECLPSSIPTAMPAKLGVYAIDSKLGEGGMGAVYRGTDTRLKRPVAIKVMKPEIAAQPTARARFLREAQAMAAVRHEHVATIFAANEEPDGLTWLAMELLEGESLDDAIKRGERFDWKTILRLGREVALGLQAAHAKKLIHRDIKPANIWLESPEAKVKLLDFGLARQAEADQEVTGTGAFIGTPSYMSPEQANGDPLDGRCDLFSLGVLLYRLTTGKLPFTGATVMATIAALATKDPTPVISLKPDCPSGLADLIHRLLSKNRDDRPASAKFVADELLKLNRDGSQTLVNLPPIVEALPVADPWASIDDVDSVTNTDQTISTANKSEVSSQAKDNKKAVATSAKSWWIALPLLVILIGVFIIIKVTNKDGSVTELKVPDESKVEVNGQTVIAQGPKKSVDPLPKTFKNSIGMEFVLVGKGTGWLGGGGGKQGEKKVEFDRDFYLGKYEVTQEEWEAVTGQNPSHFSRKGDGREAVKYIKDEDLKRFPVEDVFWDDCRSFINKLNQREKDFGRVYRLPTEEEWEYASRGGSLSNKQDSAFDFYFGMPTNQLLPGQANFAPDPDNGRKGLQRPSKTGSYQPNRLGLYDMHGNVWEWCDNMKTLDGASRPFRSGCWRNVANSCRSAVGFTTDPSYRCYDLGLRIVLVPAEVNEKTVVPEVPKKLVEPLP